MELTDFTEFVFDLLQNCGMLFKGWGKVEHIHPRLVRHPENSTKWSWINGPGSKNLHFNIANSLFHPVNEIRTDREGLQNLSLISKVLNGITKLFIYSLVDPGSVCGPRLFALFSSPFAMYDIYAGVSSARDLHRGHKVYMGIRKVRGWRRKSRNNTEAAIIIWICLNYQADSASWTMFSMLVFSKDLEDI